MLEGTNADRNLSAEKMKESEVLRTVEGLRGRLVAERAISKAAKDDALLMGNKVIELENNLKRESKSKKKAEKKLNMLVKKLETLKINYVSQEHSSTSSTSPGVIDPEQIQQSKSQFSSYMNADTEQDRKHIVAEATNTEHNDSAPSNEDMSTTTMGTSTTSFPDSNSDRIEGSAVEIKEDIKQSSYNYSSLKSSNEEAGKSDDNVDNNMALVVVPESSLQMPSSESKDNPETVISGSASEVLCALRHAREQIQRALERRHVLNAGSTNTRIC